MKKVFFITRSFLPDINGGTIARASQVNFLKNNGFEVVVLVPKEKAEEKTINNVKVVSFYSIYKIDKKLKNKLIKLESKNFIPDKYFFWSLKVIKYLKKNINERDIVFATTGGGLESFYVAYKMKKYNKKIKTILNYHDPIDYTKVNGLVIDNKKHKLRDKYEKKYISTADIIITASEKLKNAIQTKYKINNIFSLYFGYENELSPVEKYELKEKSVINIMYAGNFGKLQNPFLLLEVFERLNTKEKYKIHYIGNIPEDKKHLNSNNIILLDKMPQEDLFVYIENNIDIAFVSLVNEYVSVCMPSKIFDYINSGLPIIGLMPEGDAMDLVNSKNYGKIYHYNEINHLAQFLDNLVINIDDLWTYKKNVIRDRQLWRTDNTYKKILEVI